jgi:large subunit ribosomal protein L14
MIYQGSRIKVVDNSGALTALCIKVLAKSPRCAAFPGDKIVIVVKTGVSGKRVAKSQIHRAVLLRSPKNKRRVEGTYVKFSKPGCVLLKKDNQPLANKVHGPSYRECRPQGHLKIVSISTIAV